MPTPKKLDVVYFVKDGPNEELRYSLRSVDKNLAHRSVWIYGGKPDWANPDHFVRIPQNTNNGTKWDRVRSMMRQVCLNEEITDDFILFNDDFYIMKPTEEITPAYRCPLADHIITLEENYQNKLTEYSLELRKAYKKLIDINKPTKSYELHTPIVLNRHKLLEVLGAFPDGHCTRTLYSNYHGVGGTQMNDVKVYKQGQEINKAAQFLSSEDSVFNTSGMQEYLAQQFPEKSRFENH